MSDPAGHRIFWVPAVTSVTADAVFHRTPDHLAGTIDPGGQAGNRRTAYAGREALCKASSGRGEVAGASPGPEQIHLTKNGVRMDERGVADASLPLPVRK